MHKNPTSCNERACKLCSKLYTGPEWTSNCGIVLNTARATCNTRNLIYIVTDSLTNDTLYIGTTAQPLNTRIAHHMRHKSSFRKQAIKIVPIPGAFKAVHRVEIEQHLIHQLKPVLNKQINYFWWNARCHHHNDLPT